MILTKTTTDFTLFISKPPLFILKSYTFTKEHREKPEETTIDNTFLFCYKTEGLGRILCRPPGKAASSLPVAAAFPSLLAPYPLFLTSFSYQGYQYG